MFSSPQGLNTQQMLMCLHKKPETQGALWASTLCSAAPELWTYTTSCLTCSTLKGSVNAHSWLSNRKCNNPMVSITRGGGAELFTYKVNTAWEVYFWKTTSSYSCLHFDVTNKHILCFKMLYPLPRPFFGGRASCWCCSDFLFKVDGTHRWVPSTHLTCLWESVSVNMLITYPEVADARVQHALSSCCCQVQSECVCLCDLSRAIRFYLIPDTVHTNTRWPLTSQQTEMKEL